ncbi:MAG: class F sortase, partial [Chloroflexota bacterium]
TNLRVEPATALPASEHSIAQSTAPLTIPGPLVDPSLGLLRGPVDVPLQVQIPALNINAPVMGVGLTLTNAMSSPRGIRADDPLWETVFWYRGGGIPGDVGTATLAGHYDDALGRPAVFAFLGNLKVGDLIIVRDQRSGLDVTFIVSETQTYTDQEAAEPAVLARIFGAQAVSSAEAPPVSDQLAHLTLITCAGAWVNGSFNLRLVVYAIRASYPL